MRIALLGGARSVEGGTKRGTLAFVTDLAYALRQRGHEVHVFRAESIRRSEYRRVGDVHHHIISADVRATVSNTLAEAIVYYLNETQSVAGPFDVVHAHHRALLPALDRLRVYGGPKLFVTLHSDAGLSIRRGAGRDPTWTVIDILDGVMTSSKELRDKIAERLLLSPQSIDVTYPGIDQARYARWADRQKVRRQIQMNGSDPLVLFVGELVRSLGPDLLLEAAFEVLDEFPEAKFAYVGDGPMAPYLIERAKVLGILASLRFLRFTPEEQVIDLYNSCDLVCVPARSGRVDRTVLEAWCAGKPTIVGQSSTPEFFEPQATGLAPKADVPAVTQDILRCLRQREFAAELGARAWNRVSCELSWTAIAKKSEEQYQQNENWRTTP